MSETLVNEAIAIGLQGTANRLPSLSIIAQVDAAAKARELIEGSSEWNRFRNLAFGVAITSATNAARTCMECATRKPGWAALPGQALVYCNDCQRCLSHCRCEIKAAQSGH